MSTDTNYEIPVPSDLNSITAVHDGGRWMLGVVKGSVTLNDGVLSFVTVWHGTKRRMMMATDIISGYQCDE